MSQFHPFSTILRILSQIQRKNAVMVMMNLPMSKEVMSGSYESTLKNVVVFVKSLKYSTDFLSYFKGVFLCRYFLDRVGSDHVWVKFNHNQVHGQKTKSRQ